MFSMYDPFQLKVMHHTSGMSNRWKWPINMIGIWYEKVLRKVAPAEPIHSGR